MGFWVDFCGAITLFIHIFISSELEVHPLTPELHISFFGLIFFGMCTHSERRVVMNFFPFLVHLTSCGLTPWPFKGPLKLALIKE